VTLPDFDYTSQTQALEVPIAQRIAEIRQRKREDRERGRLKAARRAAAQRPGSPPDRPHTPHRPDQGGHSRFGRHRRGR